MPLFELEIKYGGTEAGKRLYLLTSWCLIRKSNFAPVMGISDCGGFPNYILENFAWFGAPLFSIFSICSIHLFAREYIQDIQKSQKGRPHPDRQAWPMHGLQFWFSRECNTAFASSTKILGCASFGTTQSTVCTKSTSWRSTRVDLAWLSQNLSSSFHPCHLSSRFFPCWMMILQKLDALGCHESWASHTTIYNHSVFSSVIAHFLRVSSQPPVITFTVPFCPYMLPRRPWECCKDKDVEEGRSWAQSTCRRRWRWFPGIRVTSKTWPKGWGHQKSTHGDVWFHGSPFREKSRKDSDDDSDDNRPRRRGRAQNQQGKKPADESPEATSAFFKKDDCFFLIIFACYSKSGVVCLWKVKQQKQDKKDLEKAIRGLRPEDFVWFVSTGSQSLMLCAAKGQVVGKQSSRCQPDTPFAWWQRGKIPGQRSCLKFLVCPQPFDF